MISIAIALLAFLASVITLPAAAQTYGPTSTPAQPQVQAACVAAPTTFNHVWYFDPVNGKTMTAWTAAGIPVWNPQTGTAAPAAYQGDAQHPWNSVQATFALSNAALVPGYSYPLLSTAPYSHAAYTSPYPSTATVATSDVPGKWLPADSVGTNPLDAQSPIQPGDEILLASGNYGAFNLAAYLVEINNSAWVTFAAAPGATPVFTSIAIGNINQIEFIGIKAQNLAPAYDSGWVVEVYSGGGAAGVYATGPLLTHDIIFYNSDISNADEAVGDSWSQVQWFNNTNTLLSVVGSVQDTGVTCVSATHNHIHDGHFLASIAASNWLLANNEIDHFGDDALDYSGNNFLIQNNFIHDPVNLTQEAPVTITAINAATGVFTYSGGTAPLVAGDAIDFAGASLPSGLTYTAKYYVLPGATATTFQIAATATGPAIIPGAFTTSFVASGSPEGTPFVYAHVDDMQMYSAPHAAGQTILTWSGGVIDSNLVFDRWDAANPFPTTSDGINDFDGDANLEIVGLRVTNNVIVNGGVDGLLFDLVDGTSLFAGNTVISDGTAYPVANNAYIYPPPAITVSQFPGTTGARICNNIAPIIQYTTPGVESDHNLVTGEINFYTQAVPGGPYATAVSRFAAAEGKTLWVGPAGSQATPDANHTNLILEELGTDEATLFQSLVYGSNRVVIPGVIPNLTLIPNSLASTVGTADCGPTTNFAGSTRSLVADALSASQAATAAQTVVITDQSVAAADQAIVTADQSTLVSDTATVGEAQGNLSQAQATYGTDSAQAAAAQDALTAAENQVATDQANEAADQAAVTAANAVVATATVTAAADTATLASATTALANAQATATAAATAAATAEAQSIAPGAF